jgi:hypothetical protein
MPEFRRGVFSALALLALIPAVVAAQQASGTYRLSGNNYAVYNLVGSVSVVAGEGAQLAVEVRPQGTDASALRVSIGDIRGRSTLRVIYPAGDVIYGAMGAGNESSLTVQDDGTFGDGYGRGHQVRLRASGSGTHASSDMRLLLPAGAALDLHLGVGSVTVRNIEGNLAVDVGAATVDVDGVTGNFSLDAGSAPIKLARVKGREISLDTGSGSIEGADLAATSLSLDSGSGDVILNGLSADAVSLDTGSGSVTVTLNTDVDQLSLDSGSGDVTIYAPANLGAQLEVDGGSGDVDIRVPLANRQVEEDDNSVRGTLGDGKGSISIDSGSGDVRILPR